MRAELKVTAPACTGMALPGPLVVVCHSPWAHKKVNQTALARWRRHVLSNAAPRDRSYMEALRARYFPSCEVLEISGKDLRIPVLPECGSIVLLFPDPIGLGFNRIEKKLSDHRGGRRLFALNGRGRLLVLDSPALRRLRLRRFLAWTRIPEFLCLTVFLALTPVLVAMDLLRGRR